MPRIATRDRQLGAFGRDELESSVEVTQRGLLSARIVRILTITAIRLLVDVDHDFPFRIRRWWFRRWRRLGCAGEACVHSSCSNRQIGRDRVLVPYRRTPVISIGFRLYRGEGGGRRRNSGRHRVGDEVPRLELVQCAKDNCEGAEVGGLYVGGCQAHAEKR